MFIECDKAMRLRKQYCTLLSLRQGQYFILKYFTQSCAVSEKIMFKTSFTLPTGTTCYGLGQ